MIQWLITLSLATLLIAGNSYNYLPVLFSFFTFVKVFINAKSFYGIRTISVKENFQNTEYKYNKKWIIIISGTFIFYFMIFVIYRFLMQGHNSEMDTPSRALLFLPLLWWPFSINYEKIIKSIFIGSSIGSIVGACVSSYGKFIMHEDRAFPAPYMPIQAGDMAMSLGLFCFVGIFWSLYNKCYYTAVFMAIGFISGTYASIISGSRGGG